MMKEKNIDLNHTTIFHCFVVYAVKSLKTTTSLLKVRRLRNKVVDSRGNILGFLLIFCRVKQVAKSFFQKSLKRLHNKRLKIICFCFRKTLGYVVFASFIGSHLAFALKIDIQSPLEDVHLPPFLTQVALGNTTKAETEVPEEEYLVFLDASDCERSLDRRDIEKIINITRTQHLTVEELDCRNVDVDNNDLLDLLKNSPLKDTLKRIVLRKPLTGDTEKLNTIAEFPNLHHVILKYSFNEQGFGNLQDLLQLAGHKREQLIFSVELDQESLPSSKELLNIAEHSKNLECNLKFIKEFQKDSLPEGLQDYLQNFEKYRVLVDGTSGGLNILLDPEAVIRLGQVFADRRHPSTIQINCFKYAISFGYIKALEELGKLFIQGYLPIDDYQDELRHFKLLKEEDLLSTADQEILDWCDHLLIPEHGGKERLISLMDYYEDRRENPINALRLAYLYKELSYLLQGENFASVFKRFFGKTKERPEVVLENKRLQLYRQALRYIRENDPLFPEVRIQWALVLMEKEKREGLQEKNLQEIEGLLTEAIEKSFSLRARFHRAYFYEKIRHDEQKAEEDYKFLVDREHVYAQFHLGSLYIRKAKVVEISEENKKEYLRKGLLLYQRAANQGNTYAQYHLWKALAYKKMDTYGILPEELREWGIAVPEEMPDLTDDNDDLIKNLVGKDPKLKWLESLKKEKHSWIYNKKASELIKIKDYRKAFELLYNYNLDEHHHDKHSDILDTLGYLMAHYQDALKNVDGFPSFTEAREEAKKLFEKAIALDRNPSAETNLGFVYFEEAQRSGWRLDERKISLLREAFYHTRNVILRKDLNERKKQRAKSNYSEDKSRHVSMKTYLSQFRPDNIREVEIKNFYKSRGLEFKGILYQFNEEKELLFEDVEKHVLLFHKGLSLFSDEALFMNEGISFTPFTRKDIYDRLRRSGHSQYLSLIRKEWTFQEDGLFTLGDDCYRCVRTIGFPSENPHCPFIKVVFDSSQELSEEVPELPFASFQLANLWDQEESATTYLDYLKTKKVQGNISFVNQDLWGLTFGMALSRLERLFLFDPEPSYPYQMDFSRNGLDDDCIEKLINLFEERRQLSHIRSLNFHDNRFSSKSLRMFIPLLQQENFKWLVVTGNYLRSLEDIPALEKILEIDFHLNDDEIARVLQKIVCLEQKELSYKDRLPLPAPLKESQERYYGEPEHPVMGLLE